MGKEPLEIQGEVEAMPLPKAAKDDEKPPRCRAGAYHDCGRWGEWGRCQNMAKYTVTLPDGTTIPLCGTHVGIARRRGDVEIVTRRLPREGSVGPARYEFTELRWPLVRARIAEVARVKDTELERFNRERAAAHAVAGLCGGTYSGPLLSILTEEQFKTLVEAVAAEAKRRGGKAAEKLERLQGSAKVVKPRAATRNGKGRRKETVRR
jgi:hypothetical protein